MAGTIEYETTERTVLVQTASVDKADDTLAYELASDPKQRLSRAHVGVLGNNYNSSH